MEPQTAPVAQPQPPVPGSNPSDKSNAEKTKKILMSLLYAKKIDRVKLKEFFLENYSRVPQEHRLAFWKSMLGILSIFPSQFQTIDSILSSHYNYLKHTIVEVLKISYKNMDELNYCIYLLDRDLLPLNETEIFKNSRSFCLIYKQIGEILDDADDFDLYYLTAKLYDYLRENLKAMQEKFYSHFSNNTIQLLQQINIEQIFLTALAGVFKDLTMYHNIWDRIVIGEFELLIYTMISIFEHFQNEHLKHFLMNPNYLSKDLIQKLGQDESRIWRTANKYYKTPPAVPLNNLAPASAGPSSQPTAK